MNPTRHTSREAILTTATSGAGRAGFFVVRHILLAVLLLFSGIAGARSIETINAEKARQAAREQVMWQGRLCPLYTPALDFLKSIYGKSSYKGLSPVQVVYGWALRPEVWKDEKIIRIADDNLQELLHVEEEYISFAQLFDDTLGYKLNNLGADLPEHMRPLLRETPAVVSLDEKVGTIIMLTRGQLFQPRPADMAPLPSWCVEAEILWSSLPEGSVVGGVAAITLIAVAILFARRKKARKNQ